MLGTANEVGCMSPIDGRMALTAMSNNVTQKYMIRVNFF